MLSTADLRPSQPTNPLVLETEIPASETRRDDAYVHPLAAARGILIGVVISLGLWAAIFALAL